jgi:hypothetical protein
LAHENGAIESAHGHFKAAIAGVRPQWHSSGARMPVARLRLRWRRTDRLSSNPTLTEAGGHAPTGKRSK